MLFNYQFVTKRGRKKRKNVNRQIYNFPACLSLFLSFGSADSKFFHSHLFNTIFNIFKKIKITQCYDTNLLF